MYNEVADHRGWISTTTFLSELFGEVKYKSNDEPDSNNMTSVENIIPNVIPIDYDDIEGNETIALRGYLALPGETQIGPLPLVGK